MTQEQKDLLLKDLCARLPYGVNCKIYHKYRYYDMKLSGVFDNEAYFTDDNGSLYIDYENIKPYLFPLSSMTEEQKQEYTYIVNYISSDDTENWKEGEFIYVEQFTQLMHFYHINHLDYMGLIPMGLANDATGLNIY